MKNEISKTVRLPLELMAAIKRSADKNGRTVSGEIRFALSKYIKHKTGSK